MPRYIPKDFKPSPHVFDTLRKYGCLPEFCETQMDEFMAYWLELKAKMLTKGKKESWDKTFINWMKRAWQGKPGREWEQHRHYQFRAPCKGNPFEQVMENLKPPVSKPKAPMPPTIPKDYVVQHIPKEGPTMTAEEAFEQLRKQGVL